MKYASSLPHFVALTVIPMVNGIAFGGPEPTVFGAFPAREAKPIPTKAPTIADLRKRQSNLYTETCGWIDNDLGTYSSSNC